MILSFVSWWKLCVCTGSWSRPSTLFSHRKHINRHVLLDRLVFCSLLLFSLIKPMPISWRMNHGLPSCCSPNISVLRLCHYNHDASSLKEKKKSAVRDWKWIIFIVICWWWFYHAPARTMNLYLLTGYQMNLHATHPKNID